MKLLKVGSSPSCDIVINNPYVSAHHANIIVLDNGEILIEDCGSSNGTFLGVQKSRLKPGVETPIHRGDRVMLGNEPLPWNKVPQATNRPGARTIVNIGSSQRNDIVVPGNTVSRYHAVMYVDKDGKVWIVDNKSTNGTQVNGLKIAPERPTQIRRGDNVVIGGEDISASVEQFIPKGGKAGKVVGIILGAIAAVALIVIGVINWSDWFRSTEVPDSAVVMVYNEYHYNLNFADNPYKLPGLQTTETWTAMGTGFFIDEEGRIATNRHVACPWYEEYQEMDAYSKLKIQDKLKQAWDEYINKMPKYLEKYEELYMLGIMNNNLANAIYKASDGSLRKANQILERIRSTPVVVSGESDRLAIAYSGRHYTLFDEYSPAVLVAEGDKDKDIAILQLNTKETPKKIIDNGILNIEDAFIGKPGIQKEEFMFKGYPEGIYRTLDNQFNVSNMVPTTYRGKCSRNDSPYKFEIQATITHGASGSPVYYNGRLYGLVTQVYKVGDDVIIVPARWLKELYEEKVLPYRE